ncbi:NACHT domain protein [Pestalotiopsis sp. NC0098]|nr:NACHT domain protein [Pestalotiopsis sp. NC0098]
MAPSALVAPATPPMSSFMAQERRVYSRQMAGAQHDSRKSSTRMSTTDTSAITNMVSTLQRRSGDELGSRTSAKLQDQTYDSIREWIGAQRMSQLPPEGSSYDKVLTWTQLFVERLNSFDQAIQGFAKDSYLASQLAYGYCSILLDLGQENAPALMISFGFFYSISMSLVNLLERTELFSVSQDIREQLVLALSDLVNLVASVATHFHKTIHDASTTATTSVSVNMYSSFSGQIKAFRDRCEKIGTAMWRHQLITNNMDADNVSDVKMVKSWAMPEDRVLNNVALSLSLLAHDREELTCLWVGPYLTRFLKSQDTVFSINGKPGSGKSIVASVIVDYLQRPISGVHFNTLFVPISSRIPAESTERGIAKALLSQLFEKRIGNIELLQILHQAQKRCDQVTTNEEYDNIVWNALELALSAALPGARELIIVIDGIDEATCGEQVLFKRLMDATANGSNVKLITLGTEKHPRVAGRSSFAINDDLIFDDIMAVVRSHFDSDNEFSTMSDIEQESIITRLSEAANGSFLWAKLATKRLRREVGLDKFRSAVDSVIKAKPSIAEFVARTLQSSSITDETRQMLTWLTNAERPLALRELATLASIKLDKNTISEVSPDVLKTLRPVQNLVFLQDGLVYIRHGLIRCALRDLQTKGHLTASITDPHADMTNRLLFYIKNTVTEQREPSMNVLDGHDASQLLNKYPLLDFAVRHWPYHFTKSLVFMKDGESAAFKTFSRFVPSSVTALLLQGTLWAHRPKPLLLTYQTMITNMYRQVFTDKSPMTLQSVIFLAILYQQVDRHNDAAPLFWEASIMSHKILGSSHTVTTEMAHRYIEMTESKRTTKKTDIMIKREEILQILVECYKAEFGQKSTKAASALRMLHQHYEMTKEEQKAKKITESIQTITTTSSGEELNDEDGPQVELKEPHRHDRVNTWDLAIKEQDKLIESSGSWDFTYALKEAEMAASKGKIEAADHVYAEIWQRVSQEYRNHHTDLWAERNLRAVLGYSKFLQANKRSNEASAILASVWKEYSHSTTELSENTASLLSQVGWTMKSVGISTMALSVFKHCSEYYSATNRTQSSVFKEIQQSIQETSQEVVRMANSKDTVVSEASLEETVRQLSNSYTTMNHMTFEVALRLASLYISQHRWEDATQFLKKVLRVAWPSLFTGGAQDVVLPTDHAENCVELAEKLGDCYRSPRRRAKEEDVRLRIYRALRAGRKIDDKTRERATNELLSMYRRTSQTESFISIKQEMLDDLTEHYRPDHPMVIKTLWELAELTHPQPIYVEYYQKLIHALNKDAEVSSPDALQPVVIVAQELWRRGRLSDALPYYRTLFNTFLKSSKTNSTFQNHSFVREFFEQYISCLRHSRTQFSVINKAATEYQSRCKTLYGASTDVTISATLLLARICQESEANEKRSIELYEELMEMKSSEIDKEEIRATLERISEDQVNTMTVSTSSTMSSAQLSRTQTVLRTRVTKIRETHGWAHEESLSTLNELVKVYSKQHETESMLNELKNTSVNILKQETSSVRLMAAALAIAHNYMSTNQTQKAQELLEEMHRQIVVKDNSNSKQVGFDLSSRGREALIFLAQMEHSLRRNSAGLAETLATLTTQYFYFREFRNAIEAKSSSFLQLSLATARLHRYLTSCNQTMATKPVLDQFSRWFMNTEAKRLNLDMKPQQTKLLLQSIISHFAKYTSDDIVRSVGIIGTEQVPRLIEKGEYNDACDLATACFKYVSAHESYHTVNMAKMMLTMGMALDGRESTIKPDEASRKRLVETSKMIMHEVLENMSKLNINLALMDLKPLNRLIGKLGEQEDYKTLALLLTTLWKSRETQGNWPPSATFNLARRTILARYLVGETMAATRMAEHIVYNCRRVHSVHHPATLEMSVLLAQLYSGIAQRYQSSSDKPDAKDMANRYYKKSAAIHENILRVFSDPAYASVESSALMDGGFRPRSMSVSSMTESGGVDSPTMAAFADSFPDDDAQLRDQLSDGEHVRQHLRLLKLSLERLGDWPKDYAEYEHLGAEVFREFGADLDGVQGVDKWNLKSFGNGRAEANDDLINAAQTKSWELIETV